MPMETAWAYRSPGYRALNLRFGVRTTDPDVGAYLDHVLSGLKNGGSEPEIWYSISRSTDGTGCVYPLHFGSELVVRAHDQAFAVETLLWHLNSAVVDGAGPMVVLHAAGVVLNGAGVIISGPSGSGKTTLTAALVRAGFRYLTDEALAIDPTTHRLLPFPKALAIKRGSWGLLADLRPPPSDLSGGIWHVVPTDIRADAVADVAQPSLVLLSTREGSSERSDEPELEAVSRADAVVELFRQSFGSDRPGATLRTLADVSAECVCFRVRTRDLDHLVERVTEVTSAPVG
jgi:hypothetical protein